jgi:hypothetical protein
MTTHDDAHVTTHEHSSSELLTVAEASAVFGVSVSTVRRMLTDGKLPNASKRKGPRGDEWVIPPADLTALGYQTDVTQMPAQAVQSADLDALRAEHEQQLRALREAHSGDLDSERRHYAQLLDAERRQYAAQVEKLTERAEYERQLRETERQLREAQGQTLNVLTALVAQTRKGRKALERTTGVELRPAPSSDE